MAGPLGWGIVEAGWRKGPWTAEEDKLLIEYVSTHGEGRWNSVARLAGLRRNGKSCRLRWVNYLRPDLKRGQITPHEENIILELHARWGNRWSTIARSLPGRTDNEIKNYWRTHFKKAGKPSQSPEKPKSRAQSRQQQEKKKQPPPQRQQQERQQQQQFDMKKIMSPVEEGDYRLPSMVPSRPEMVFLCPPSEEQVLYSMIHGDSTMPEASSEEGLWGGLWDFYDLHADLDYANTCATGKAGQNQVIQSIRDISTNSLPSKDGGGLIF
ncbi:hypothetical protein AAC387_Pa12g2390 [Persea americana]